MGTRWQGLLAPIDKPTGDGRRMGKDAMRWRELPLGLKWQRVDSEGHDDSVIIGSTDAINIGTAKQAVDKGWISADAVASKMEPGDLGVWGMGDLFDDVNAAELPRLAEDVAEAKLLLSRRVIGPSVDAGAATAILVETGTDEPLTEERFDELWLESMDTGQDMPIEMLFTDYEIAASTLVAIPAFAEARPFELLAQGDCPPGQHQGPDGTCMPDSYGEMALTAAVVGATDLPIADRATAWDGQAATGRVFDACTDGDTVDAACVARAYLYRDEDADPATQAAYKLGYADIIDGELRIVPAGVAACAGGRGVDAADLPADQADTIKAKICTLYGQIRDQFDDWPDCPFDSGDAADEAATTARVELATALTAAAAPLPADVFARPAQAPGYQLVTVHDPRPGEPFRRVSGYAAAFGVCHLGFKDVCIVPPESTTDYALFHRYVENTTDGPVTYGRLTTGHGRVGTGCSHLECRGKDDHACDYVDLAGAIAHYDRLRTVAHVRAHEFDGTGVWVTGIVAPDATADDLRVLSRQRVSGDWREVGAAMEMVELLALAREEPGFPIPHAGLRDGRQVSLTAAVPRPVPQPADLEAATDRHILSQRFAQQVAGLVVASLNANTTASTAAVTITPSMTAAEPAQHTGAMIALRMADDDAAALAVDGGEPAGELHMTLAFLGDASAIPGDTQTAILDAMRALVGQHQATGGEDPTGRSFAVSAFNPAADAEQDTAIVLGLSGAELSDLHTAVMDKLGTVFSPPEQYAPWAAHVTLAYTEDLSIVGRLADRTNREIRFDRLRVAFAGEFVDIPFVAPPESPADEAARLAAEVEAAVESVDAAQRARLAAMLQSEIEGVAVGV